MRIILVIVLILISGAAFSQQNKCYPGLDCPDDIPGRRYENAPPISPVPEPETRPRQTSQSCADPYGALVNMLFTGSQPQCTLPATHCCFEDGSALYLREPGSISFGDYCYKQVQFFGTIIPVQGLGCRR